MLVSLALQPVGGSDFGHYLAFEGTFNAMKKTGDKTRLISRFKWGRCVVGVGESPLD